METVTSEFTSYNKVGNFIRLSSEYVGMPKEITIVSRNTGRKVVYIVDEKAALAHEFWDGEMMQYTPKFETDKDCPKLIIAHEW